MNPQAGCSTNRCFGRAGTADSRRQLRGGSHLLGRIRNSTSFASFPSVPRFSFFHFFLGVLTRHALITGTILPQIAKSKKPPGVFLYAFFEEKCILRLFLCHV